MKGTLTGIGVGPGDPELLTLKAVNAIKNTNVLFYPVTRPEADSAALKVVEEWVSPETRRIPLLSRMTSDPEERKTQRLQQGRKIGQVLDEGTDAVMVTLGDALLYSTYSYIMKDLKRSGYSVCTIPGISAVSAASACLNIPLAEEDEKLMVLPGTGSKEELNQQLDSMPDNLALLKVSACRETLHAWLRERESTVEFALASRLGGQDQVLYHDIRCLENTDLPYMTVALLKRKEKTK